MGSCKRDFHCSGETAVSDRETGDMFVSAGSAACFGSVPCRKLQRQESSNQTFLIKESTNLESTVVPRAAVLFLILIVKKKM